MPIFKNKKNKNYTVIDNEILQRDNLSWKAKGLLCYLLSLPPDWEIHLSELEKHATDGQTAVRSGVKELREAGYIIYKKIKDEKGHYSHQYWVYDKPHNPQKPEVENPDMEKPNMDNGNLLSTYELSTDVLSKYLSTDHQDGYPTQFEEMWQQYPRKVGKKSAFKKWLARIREGFSYEQLRFSAENYANMCQSEDRAKRYIMHPRTFFGPDHHFEDFLESNESESDSVGMTEGVYNEIE